MLVFLACCHVRFYLVLRVSWFFLWSEVCGVSALKIDSDTSHNKIASKSCTIYTMYILLNSVHKSHLGLQLCLSKFCIFELTSGWCPRFIFHSFLSFLCPCAMSLHPCKLWPKGVAMLTLNQCSNAFGWESAAVPGALVAWPQFFLQRLCG